MKKITLSLTLLILAISVSTAQITVIELNARSLCEERKIALNGKFRDVVAGGQSRIAIPVDLPSGTIEWFYSFTTTEGGNGTKILNLAIQLSSLSFDPTGTSAKILSRLEVPGGTTAINAYVLDANNKTAFLEGDEFKHIEEGSSLATKQAVVKIDDVRTGRWFIGLENPSALDGVNISIEVVAIVREEVYVDQWSADNLSIIESACMNAFRSQGLIDHKKQVCQCFLDELQATIKPSKWNSLGGKKEAFDIALLERCYVNTGNTSLQEQERILSLEQDRATALIEESYGAFDISNYRNAYEKMMEAILLIQNNGLEESYGRQALSGIYNTMAWFSMLVNELEVAEACLQKSHSYADDDMAIWGNTGIFHLLKGNLEEAEEAFLRYKRRDKLPDGRRWDEVINEALELLERQGFGNENFAGIRELMKIKD